jgi:D-glycero-alpha-D-manno-heptose 1-phosphate guanylyltransferase
MIQAVILVGGEGTRLRSVVNQVPKPMAQIAGKPFLEYIIRYLIFHGISEITLCVGYKAECVRHYFGDGSLFKAAITYSQEDHPLGTGGALKKAALTIKEDSFLALNGDSFFQLDFGAFVNFYKKRNAKAAIALTKAPCASRYGAVKINDFSQVIAFCEKEQNPVEGLINSGIYIFNKHIFDDCKEEKISLETSILPQLIDNDFYGLEEEGFFIDIGTPSDYSHLCSDPSRLLKALSG